MRRPAASALATTAVAMAVLVCGHQDAVAGPREQAKRIHDRLVGTPPSAAKLSEMEALVASNNPIGAANLAIDRTDPESSPFYNVTLKNFATPWTNRDMTVFAPLNDYTATVIGLVRDDEDFRRVLFDDVLYTGSGGGVPAYSPSNNNHYEALENNGVDLRTALQAQAQSALSGIPSGATAGVITSRAASEAFFIAGTNRAMFRFTLLNHLCRDMEQVQDSSRPPDRIRQDVSRSPGGDSRVFLNNCVSCHSGMDPMAQAYAYYDFDETQGRLVYTPGQVHPKYFNNEDTFPEGFVTPDDRWDNYWRAGPNSLLGWSNQTAGGGNGAKSLGQELAYSDAFAQCQVEKVFRNVCLRAPSDTEDHVRVGTMVNSFQQNGFRLKRVFAEAAAYCMGD